jgi:DNA invertase Pin-like site-specific DNA recombinase
LFSTVENYGVTIETIDQPIDTSTPSGRFTVLVLSGVAELERELIRDRTKDGLRRTVANGTKLGRKERTLSDYQRNKIKGIVANDPGISYRKLAEQFDGISRTKLIELAKTEGLIQ